MVFAQTHCIATENPGFHKNCAEFEKDKLLPEMFEFFIDINAIEEMDGRKLNFPDKIIVIPQSDSGLFDDHEFFEFIHEQLSIPNNILSSIDNNIASQSTSSPAMIRNVKSYSRSI